VEQLGSSCCGIDQSDVAARLLRAHLKSRENPQRATIDVGASGEIQIYGLHI